MPHLKTDAIYLGTADDGAGAPQYLDLKWGNRHGLIAGATGTGKTVTLQVMAEGFSNVGVPVFLSDVKGDLSGMIAPSAGQDFLLKRAAEIGFADEFKPAGFPVAYWDSFGEKGLPARVTIQEMGPLLLARVLELNDTQESVLHIAFRLADEEGLLLLDLKDLRALLTAVADRREEISKAYGNVAPATVAAIQRNVLRFEEAGGEAFFGEPALDLADFMKTDASGKGQINILAADKLIQNPRSYSSFLLWLLSELFEQLPEIGDAPKPKLVFFFDEAHLLFQDTPKALLEKIEQVVRLIRSKGVGVYFITQNPDDVPENILGQLGHRVQHALRAFTPQQQKAIKSAAQTYRPNPAFDVKDVITSLRVGEALVSTLEGHGEPSMVQKTLIRPPSSQLGPVAETARQDTIRESLLYARYAVAKDRESAYEMLAQKAQQSSALETQEERVVTRAKKASGSTTSRRETIAEAATKTLVRTVTSSIGRSIAQQILRGIMGSLKR